MTYQSGLQGRRVLVVEDEPLIALDIESMLDSLGCSVVGTAYDVTEALTLCENLLFDVVLLDVMLKGQSSLEISQLLMTRCVAVILATGLDATGLPDAYRQLPMLSKPFGPQQLEEALHRASTTFELEEHIRMTAYFLWEQDGRPDGQADKYWHAALERHERERSADKLLRQRPRSQG